eukprot:4978812-Amphidinium_carterae.1
MSTRCRNKARILSKSTCHCTPRPSSLQVEGLGTPSLLKLVDLVVTLKSKQGFIRDQALGLQNTTVLSNDAGLLTVRASWNLQLDISFYPKP